MNMRRRPVTEGQLRELVLQANINAGTPTVHYVQGRAQVGHYTLSYAYGGVALHQIKSEGGSVRDVFGLGHMPKRELFQLLWSWTPAECRGTAEQSVQSTEPAKPKADPLRTHYNISVVERDHLRTEAVLKEYRPLNHD